MASRFEKPGWRPERGNQWWVDPKTGRRWNVVVEWKTIGTRAEPGWVQIIAHDDGKTYVTAEAVRRIPLGAIIADLRQGHRDLHKRVAGARKAAQRFGPRRGRALDDADLRAVADLYRAAFEKGDPVIAAVAEACHVSKSAAAKRIAAARERGFLRAAVGTKAGEQPAHRARKR